MRRSGKKVESVFIPVSFIPGLYRRLLHLQTPKCGYRQRQQRQRDVDRLTTEQAAEKQQRMLSVQDKQLVTTRIFHG